MPIFSKYPQRWAFFKCMLVDTNTTTNCGVFYEMWIGNIMQSTYIKESVCVRPSVRYPIGWKTQGNGYHSVSGKITQCDGYHSVSGLFVRKTGSLSAMGKLLGGL